MSIVAKLLVVGAALALTTSALHAQDIPPIARKLPAPGTALPDADKARLQTAVNELKERIAKAGTAPLLADAAVFVKAVDFALRQNEFYDAKKDVAKADWALKQAGERLDQLKTAPWNRQTGTVPRGYLSVIDGSYQPYGMVIPAKLDLGKPQPLYIWLHGRSENDTDLHFLSGRAHAAGEVHPDDVLVAHAFGRQCVGFKSAGEIDMLELLASVEANYQIDPDRVVLMGFSMGGAGAKHLGAHYADHFAAVHAGAGFAETARYLGIKPDEVPWYEATLWGLYDTPDYVRNLFNLPFICYSGEMDKQIQAARVMEEAYKENGQTLTHIIGPGVGHQYQADALKKVLALVHQAVEKGRSTAPAKLTFQTRTLRYPSMFWVEALALDEHWKDSRIDAQAGDAKIELTTVNIQSLRLTWPKLHAGATVAIDGQTVKLGALTGAKPMATLVKADGQWSQADDKKPADAELRKLHGLQGPIDDVFMAPFLVVEPSGHSSNETFQRWADFERKHFLERWSLLMRGEARVKKDSEVTEQDIANYNLILWGDAGSNKLIAKVADKLPLKWDAKTVAIGEHSFDAAGHAPSLIYPNPLNPARYVVLNSGLTFREAHDKTNSQQNPKLPDWAIIDLSKLPDETAPGKIADAGFFDEHWQVKKSGH